MKLALSDDYRSTLLHLVYVLERAERHYRTAISRAPPETDAASIVRLCDLARRTGVQTRIVLDEEGPDGPRYEYRPPHVALSDEIVRRVKRARKAMGTQTSNVPFGGGVH